MNAPCDPLQLALDGIRSVEANAGTGKTFTIAALYLRLILERGLQPGEIVVATFTRAATAELSGRVRDWLALAERALSDAEPSHAREDDAAEIRIIRRIIAQALELLAESGQADALATLRRRAREASLAIDTAQISTLHGFCFRVLAEFGFDTGSSLHRPELVEDLRALDLEIIRDFWRRGSGNVTVAEALATTWGDPETLARQVGDPRWEDRAIDPFAAATTLEQAGHGLRTARDAIAAWDDAALARAQQELTRAIGNSAARKSRIQKIQELHVSACAGDDLSTFARRVRGYLEPFGTTELEGKAWFHGPFAGVELEAVLRLSDACLDYDAASTVFTSQVLLDARAFLVRERAHRMAERGLMGHDQAVQTLRAALTADPAASVLAAIRERWKAALIDEFQDTDSVQWEVVRALFGETTLVLIGDPKQAIYGFRGGDVFAWRKAVDEAPGAPLALATSYRSGVHVCEAVNALFRVEDGFIDAGIGYHDVTASERSRLCTVIRDRTPLPGLACWSFTAADLGQGDGAAVAKGRARTALERRTVQYIAALLASATLRHGDGVEEPLQPKHIAVLVDRNREVASLQAALGEAGIPAASTLRASVFASEEADDLALLLEALADPADASRARAAWASQLLGKSASAIAASLTSEAGAPQREAAEWAATVRHQGVLAWLHGIIAATAPRLLEGPDGPRRVANYLQLAELLQDDYATGFGLGELATRFARRRAEASDDNDADSARLRLDTDADAVTVATVHAAKGLEYDVVILPYAGFAKGPSKKGKGVARYWYHDAAGDARVALGPAVADDLKVRARNESLAEDVRKLYVAVTRARALCVVPWGRIHDTEFGALFHLLHVAGRGETLPLGDAECAAALAKLCEDAPGAVGIVPWADIPVAGRWQAPAPKPVADAPRSFQRACMDRDWTVWSFSRLVRGSHNAAADTLPGAGDGGGDSQSDNPHLGGARFGSAVHAVFEAADFAAWRNVDGVPASQRALIERALADHGLPGAGMALPQAVGTVGTLLRDALNTSLPCGARLADVPPDARRAEIEFHLALAPADTQELYALLHAHGYQVQRAGIAAARLAGLMTGKIDLTFRHDGRYWIVDWKTNRCAPYDAAALSTEIARHDYDLQWIIYTLALHRWLGTTLADYEYERDFGGVFYLFVRGMQDARGVYADRPSRGLMDALDALLPAPRRVAA